ncbi:MAG TPA: hypothetical protein VMU88_04065 [bacterium]|nr:hypothetical protein [bacterium]
MRETSWMLGTFVLFMVLSFSALIQTGCSNPPTASTAITWDSPQIYDNNSGSTAHLGLQVNGAPATDVLVVLSGGFPESPVTASYSYPITDGGQAYAFYQFGSFTYTAGATYVLSSKAMGKTASVTLVGPGGITNDLDSNGAVTLVTVSHPGSFNAFYLLDSSYNPISILSPTTFPVTVNAGSAYPGASGTVYDVETYLSNSTTLVANGKMGFGQVVAFSQRDQGVTVP